MSARKPFVRLRMEAGDGTSWDYSIKPYRLQWAIYNGLKRQQTFPTLEATKENLRLAIIRWAMRDLG